MCTRGCGWEGAAALRPALTSMTPSVAKMLGLTLARYMRLRYRVLSGLALVTLSCFTAPHSTPSILSSLPSSSAASISSSSAGGGTADRRQRLPVGIPRGPGTAHPAREGLGAGPAGCPEQRHRREQGRGPRNGPDGLRAEPASSWPPCLPHFHRSCPETHLFVTQFAPSFQTN